MELTSSELDETNEIQFNLPTFELDAALGALRPEALIALRADCLACVERQSDILARIQSRLAQN